jgi:hypothetical protein
VNDRYSAMVYFYNQINWIIFVSPSDKLSGRPTRQHGNSIFHETMPFKFQLLIVISEWKMLKMLYRLCYLINWLSDFLQQWYRSVAGIKLMVWLALWTASGFIMVDMSSWSLILCTRLNWPDQCSIGRIYYLSHYVLILKFIDCTSASSL